MIKSGVCNSYKREILSGIHQASHVYKIALFTGQSNLSPDTTSYLLQQGEVVGRGYSKGGQVLKGFNTRLDGESAIVDFETNPVWQNATITARGALIYNDSLQSKNALCVVDFGVDKTSTNGNFIGQFMTPDGIRGLIIIQ